jgi:hypothetical protein
MHSGVRDLQNIMSAGPHWHVDSVENQLVDCAKYFVAPSKEESAVSLGWRALLDADPRGSLPEVIQRVKDPTWRWTEAREDVVARGLPAVPALCAAMKSNGGELRQRFEGCVSRIARDARNGVDRGALDMNAVEGYLSEPKGDLANIAAEAIGAAGPEGVKRLVAGLAVTKEAAGCAWALGYAKGVDCGTQICNVIAAPGFSPQAKANAARSAGRLGIKAAAGPLAKLIETEKDLAVQREAAWALALLDARDKDRVVATLLRSPDKATRCRAVMALAVLRSPELLKTGHMLAGGDRNEAWIATWALFPGHVFDRHVNAARDRMNPQKDGSFKSDYKEAVKYYRVHLDMLDIEKAVPRDAALALIAKAAPTQKDVILKGLMEQIPKDQNGFEYQNRPWPPKKKK